MTFVSKNLGEDGAIVAVLAVALSFFSLELDLLERMGSRDLQLIAASSAKRDELKAFRRSVAPTD